MFSYKHFPVVLSIKLHTWFWGNSSIPLRILHSNQNLEILDLVVGTYYRNCDEFIVTTVQNDSPYIKITGNPFRVSMSSKILLLWFKDVSNIRHLALCISRVEEYLSYMPNFEVIKIIFSSENFFSFDEEFQEFLCLKYNLDKSKTLYLDFDDRAMRSEAEVSRYEYKIKKEILNDLAECVFRIGFFDRNSQEFKSLTITLNLYNSQIPDNFQKNVCELILYRNNIKNLCYEIDKILENNSSLSSE